MKRILTASLIFLLGSCVLEEFEFKKPSPQAMDATNITSKSFIANWEKVVGVSKYLVDVADDPSFSDDSYVFGYKSIEVEGENLLVDDLIPNKEYYYRVRSQNKASVSGYSNTIYLLTGDLQAPVAEVLDVTETSFRLSWNIVEAAEKYSLEIALDAKFQTYLSGYQNKIITGRTTVSVTDIEAGQSYYVRIKSVKDILSSVYSEVIEVVASNLEVPVVLPPSKVRAIYFQADWEAVTGADSYILEVATDADFQSPLEGYESVETTELTHRVFGLNVFTNYYYRVRAKNALATTVASVPVYVESALSTGCKVYKYQSDYGRVELEYKSNGQLSDFRFYNTGNNLTYDVIQTSYNTDGNISLVELWKWNRTLSSWVRNDWRFFYNDDKTLDYIDIWDFSSGSWFWERQLLLEYNQGKVIRLNNFKFVEDSKGNIESEIEYVQNYEYDELGNVMNMNNRTGIETMEYDDEVNPFVVHDPNLAIFLNFNGEEDYRPFISPNNVIKRGNGYYTGTIEYQYNEKGFPVGGEALRINRTNTDTYPYPVEVEYQGCFK